MISYITPTVPFGISMWITTNYNKMVTIFLWKRLFLTLFSVAVCNATLCLICENGVSDLRLCQKVANCTNDEVCYTELYIENGNSKVWYSGCLSTQVCLQNDPSFVPKRDVSAKRNDVASNIDDIFGMRLKRVSRPGQNICTACCDDDYCNSDLCNLNMGATKRHECYNCDNIANPTECNKLTTCSETQSCFTSHRYAGGTSTMFRMGCEETTMCQAFEDNISYFNKTRANSRAIDDARVLCLTCCSYSYCNRLEDCSISQRAPDINKAVQAQTTVTIPTSKISLTTNQVTTDQTLLTTDQVTTDQTLLTTDQVTTDHTLLTTGYPVLTLDQSTQHQPAVTTNQPAMTSDQATMTTDQPMMTSDHTAMTSDQTTMASHHTAMTSDQTTMASHHVAMTSDQTTMASHHTAMTSDQTNMSSDQTTVTSGQTNMTQVPTVVIPGVKCYNCHGPLCGYPNYQQLVQCPSTEPYCLNSYLKEASDTYAVISKRCVDYVTCKTKWYEASSDVSKCDDLSVTPGQRKECYFCCVKDECNVGNRPSDNDMFSAANIQS